jgi:hypothetical protein
MRTTIPFLIALWVVSSARGAPPEYHPEEAAAVARVKKLGGSVGWQSDDPEKRCHLVRLSATKVTDADLAVFKDFPRLEWVWLVACEKVADEPSGRLRSRLAVDLMPGSLTPAGGTGYGGD